VIFFATWHDVVLWLFFAFVVLGAGSAVVLGIRAGLTVAYLAVMIGLGWTLKRWVRPQGFWASTLLMLPILAVSGLTAHVLGLKFFFGAVVAGAILPKEAAKKLLETWGKYPLLALLPFVFAHNGIILKFNPYSPDVWMIAGVGLVVCLVGQFLGTTIPEWLSGVPLKEASMEGPAMACKGLMDAVLAVFLYQHGKLSADAAAGIVIMSLASTFVVKPLWALIQRHWKKSSEKK
jgi:Kef-type K+ transport system membrane component KefB